MHPSWAEYHEALVGYLHHPYAKRPFHPITHTEIQKKKPAIGCSYHGFLYKMLNEHIIKYVRNICNLFRRQI